MSNTPAYMSGIPNANANQNTTQSSGSSYASLAVNNQASNATPPSYASVSANTPSYASGTSTNANNPSYASSGSSSYGSSGSSVPSYASIAPTATNALYGSGLATAPPVTSYPTIAPTVQSPNSSPYSSGNLGSYAPAQNTAPAQLGNYSAPGYGMAPVPGNIGSYAPAQNTPPAQLGNYSAPGYGMAPVPGPSVIAPKTPNYPAATPQGHFNQMPPQAQTANTSSHFSAPPQTAKPQATPMNEKPAPSSGGGMLSKIALKAGQMTGAGKNMAQQKIMNISRKIRAETNLVAPPGGFIAEKYEELCKVTKFSRIEEIEFLYYEFKRHVHIPEKKLVSETFTPTLNFEQFARMMPPCYDPTVGAHYKLIIQSLFTVFKWGCQSVTFDSFAKAMSIICRGNPADKLPMLYDILMDPVQRTMSQNSLRFVLTELSKLALVCPSAGNALPGARDVEYLVGHIFPNNAQTVSVQQFSEILMRNVSNPQVIPPWKMLLDGFGVFPYIYFTFVHHIEQIVAKSDAILTQKPHKEGFLIKYTLTTLTDAWCRHWAVIDGGFLWYYPSHNEYDEISRVIPLGDCKLLLSNDPNDPPYCFAIKTQGNVRKFCAEDEDSYEYWLHVIRLSKTQSKFPNHSFSPVREGMSGRWFIDGEDTYRLMEEAMMKATREIFITDWFFSPQVYLRRFDANGRPTMEIEHRLDVLLKKKADEGVKIYVLPWSETKIAIDLGSANVKAVLEKLSPNIRVLCHPLVAPIKWSHHQKTVIVDQKIAFVGGLDLCFGRWDTQQHSLTDTQQPYIFPGKDYYNPAVAEFSNVPNYVEEIVDRNLEPRMPWHDIHMMCEGEAARDVAANFIQRWNHHRDLLNEHKHILPENYYLPPSGKLSIQVVRSVCDWSAGVATTETSILNAYMTEIESAQHFIYIENQFFISSLSGSIVENQIAQALLDKVFKAIAEGRVFRVIVIVPVHPEGGYKDTATVRYIMGWQYKTVCRGGRSMVEEFNRRHPNLDITQYFHFYVVKKWDRLGDRLVHEQIYVHAKLMIVDDRSVIVGSANINDRSMIGVRDSEIAVVVKDRQMIDCAMNGQPWQVAKFAHELRCNLFLEHLGLQQSDMNLVRDPSHPSIYNRWVETAKNNANIFNELFYKQRTIPYSDDAMRKLSHVKGHICEYDQDLLSDADMGKTTGVDVLLASDDIFV